MTEALADEIHRLRHALARSETERRQLAADNRVLADQLAAAVQRNYSDMEPDYAASRKRRNQ